MFPGPREGSIKKRKETRGHDRNRELAAERSSRRGKTKDGDSERRETELTLRREV